MTTALQDKKLKRLTIFLVENIWTLTEGLIYIILMGVIIHNIGLDNDCV